MSSAFFLSYTSGPLQIGQTSISNSFLSNATLLNPGLKVIHHDLRGSDINFQCPPTTTGKTHTFYRVFLGHDDILIVPKIQIVLAKFVMIRKGMIVGLNPYACQGIEKSTGIAYARYRVNMFFSNALSGTCSLFFKFLIVVGIISIATPFVTTRSTVLARPAGSRMGPEGKQSPLP